MGEERPITAKEFSEIKKYKYTFDVALNKYQQAWKRLEGKKFKRTETKRRFVYVSHFDYAGFTKEQLKFLNFLVLKELKSEGAKKQLSELNQQICEKINSVPFCIYCNSFDVMKSGSRQNKYGLTQRFFCNNCQKSFSLGRGQATLKKLLLVLDLHYKGYSSRKIEETLPELGYHYDHGSVCRFLNLFAPYLKPRGEKIAIP